MKALLYSLIFLLMLSCGDQQHTTTMNTKNDTLSNTSGYSTVNGIKMYYEIYGEGKPLVLLHGGGSTIQTTFGRIIPLLAKHRKLIAIELQAHGRTSDRETPLSFEQDADDVAGLLKNLGIVNADFLGFSNGGTTTLQIAIRHPELVNKIIVASALAKRDGVPAQFYEFMKNTRPEEIPQAYQDAYKMVSPTPENIFIMSEKCAKRMINFKDIPDKDLQSIKAECLILLGDKDVMTPEHGVQIHRLIPNSRLAIFPSGHGDFLGEITTLTKDFKESDMATPVIERFLD